jgi:HEAT repeat protein
MSEPILPNRAIDPFANAGNSSDKPPDLPDLPPVEPPSAGFVVQLFVIPALVVVVVIIVWLLFGKLAGGERDAMEYVRQLRSPTANWRLAFELASLIQNDAKIGSDPKLLGELTDLFSHELDENEDPKLIQYLALTIGAFRTLEAKTESGRTVDPLATLARALDPKFETQVRIAAAASLAKQAARVEGTLEDSRVIKNLGEAATAGEPEVRQIAAYALGFFGGAPAREILHRRLIEDENRFVRYNAAIALARQGDLAAAPTLREMLSTTGLNTVIELPGTTEKQNKVESIELEGLSALRSSISANNPELARALRPQIEELTRSGLVSVRSQAQEVLQSLQSRR